MKINKHNTALHFLDERDPMRFGWAIRGDEPKVQVKLDIMRQQVKDAWPTLRKRCLTGKVRYISEPFQDAYERAKDRLTLDMTKDVVKESGVFIFRQDAGGGKNTIFYSMDSRPEPEGFFMKGSIMAFSSRKHEAMPALFAAYFTTRDGQHVKWFCNDKDGTGSFELFVDMFYLCLFLRYCQVETKEIQAGRKGDHVGTKYINETKSLIEIVDSSWFTTIIRSEGFGVKGHFRLQPYPSLGTKKLIYIAPFEKHGYTRKAKVLTQNPGNES